MSDELATAQPEATAAPGGQTAPETSPAAAPAASPAAAPTHSLDDELSAIFDKMSSTPEPAPKEAPAVEPEPVSPDQPSNEAPEPAQSSPAIAAPNSWSAEYQSKWNALPPELQKYVAEREGQTHAKITQQGAELRTFQPIRQVLDTFKGYYQQGQEAHFLHSLAYANAALHQDPIGTLKALAEHYGVNPAQIAGQGTAQQPAASDPVEDLFRDPRIEKQINPEIQNLKGVVQQLYGQITAREQAEQQKAKSHAEDVITEFAKDKPHWGDLEDDVTHEVALIRKSEPNLPMQDVLAKAYDRAQWANPAIRQRILDDQRKTEQEKAKKETAQQAAEAKKHADMNVRTGAAASTPTFDGKWDDQSNLEALYDRITARG